MPTGRSIHIGLNNVDPLAYGGWDGRLSGCINDATALKRIADGLGYTSSLLIDGQATSGAVIGAIGQAAADLGDGDILLLTYSGHGGQVADANGDEQDSQDETWVLFDRQLIDDELFQLWSQFAPGVRIVVLSDSCHSGTVLKMRAATAFREAVRDMPEAKALATDGRPKNMPLDVEARNGAANGSLYASLQWLSGAKSDSDLRASVILISGCQDNQLSYDGAENGRFTQELLTTWAGGDFQGGYRQLHRDILDRMPPDQSPNFATVGAQSPAFESQKPFTIDDGGGQMGATHTTLRRGDHGAEVTQLQARLRDHGYEVGVDGYFGPGTESMVRSFQRSSGLTSDGVVGSDTWAALDRAPASGGGGTGGTTTPGDGGGGSGLGTSPPGPSTGASPRTLRVGDRGEDVRRLQERLRDHGYWLAADGVFGSYTASIVRQFQQSVGVTADGVVGPQTWDALEREPAWT